MDFDDIIIILKSDVNAQTIFFEELAASKLKDKYQFEIVTTGTEAMQLLMQYQSGCLLFSVSSKKELQELAIPLKKLKKDIRNNLFKIAGYNNINNRKVEKFLKEHHVADIFEGEISLKAIEFKFNLWFRSIGSARKKYLSNPSLATNSAQAKNSNKGIETKLKSSTKTKNPIKFLEPLELHSDCFILPSENSAKNMMNSWVIELIGPGPAAGHWHDITKQTNSTTPIWKWVPIREDLFTFILDDGYWVFKGREPFFNWESNLWKFGGDKPELIFYTDKPLAKKFYIENNQLHITKTSEQAKAKLPMLKSSFDPKYNMSADDKLDDQAGKSHTEKIDMFYKGEEQQATDEVNTKNIHKSAGFKEQQGGQLTGKGSVEQQKETLPDINSKTNLTLNKSDKSSNVDKTASLTNSSTSQGSSAKLPLEQQKETSARAGFKEEIDTAKTTGKAGVEHQNNKMSGRGNLKEKMVNKTTDQKRANSSEQLDKKSSSLSTSLDLEQELEELKNKLQEEINTPSSTSRTKDPAQAVQLQKEITQLEKKQAALKKADTQTSKQKSTATTPPQATSSPKKETTQETHKSPFADTLASVLDAPVDLGDQDEKPASAPQAATTSKKSPSKQATHTSDEDPLTKKSKAITDTNRQSGQFGQHNDAIEDEYGNFKETDKEWEKYYRGGAAKKEKKKKKQGLWDGPSGKHNEFEQRGSGNYGSTDKNSSGQVNNGHLSGSIKTKAEQEREEKKAAFDSYMASIKPKAPKEKKHYEQIGSSKINFQSIDLELTLKTRSKQEGIFDLEDKIALIDIIDNIVVVKNIEQKNYMLHSTVLIHCHVYYSGKEYDFTMNGKIIEFEGEDQEIINIELTKFDQSDLDNLFLLLTERQNNITNFIQAAQGRA